MVKPRIVATKAKKDIPHTITKQLIKKTKAVTSEKPQILSVQRSYAADTVFAPPVLNPIPIGSSTDDLSDDMALQNRVERTEINKSVEMIQNHELSHSIQKPTSGVFGMVSPNAVGQTKHNESVEYDFELNHLPPPSLNDMDASARSEPSECQPEVNDAIQI